MDRTAAAELGDALSRHLSVRQLPTHDPRFGSTALLQAALAEPTAAGLDQLPWRSFLDKRSTILSALFLVAILSAAVACTVAFTSVMQLGLVRIAQPWAWTPWPRAERLELVNPPALIARDSELEVKVIDVHPPLPSLIELEVRGGVLDNDTRITRLPMRVASDLAVVTLPSMESDFAIRPVGGDQQDGPWHSIKVTRQPLLKEYAFDVEPPAYSGSPRAQLSASALMC